MSHKYVYSFKDGDGKNKKLLGGKGAGLCEMTQIGLNVPPGFVITTDACLDVPGLWTVRASCWFDGCGQESYERG